MSDPETHAPAPVPDEPTPGSEADQPPAPEPWTPERVLAWNRYYDLYLIAGVLLLVFLASATRINNSTIWAQLRAGRLIAERGTPLATDPFSETFQGRPWVNVPWTFEWSQGLLYDALASPDANREPGEMTTGDQRAAGVLVAVNATVRLLTALVLILGLKRSGPGLWWMVVCVGLAIGGIVAPPGGMALGGIAGQAQVGPETWGLLLLAIEVVILHRAIEAGRGNLAFALIPLFLLWANLDESFLVGLFVLAAGVLGTLAGSTTREAGGLRFPKGLAILIASAAACLVNPSLHRTYLAVLEPILEAVGGGRGRPRAVHELSLFGATIREQLGGLYSMFVGYFLALVGLGLASFVLNLRRFSLPRFLTFLVASVLWALVLRYRTEFAVVFAAVLALNGQEWYLGRFGGEGRMGRGWASWSVGGRAVTIVIVLAFLVKGLTGYGSSFGEPIFGFGADPDEFAFEAADVLRGSNLEGNVLNTTAGQGDALIWRAYPARKPFIDGRAHLYTDEFRAEFDALRLALRDDDVATWRPILDRDEVSAVMLDVANAQRTYQRLIRSPNWILFYDDGNVVMFGRADAPAADLAYFQQNRHDPETLAYQHGRPIPSTDRLPRVVTSFDRLFYDKVFRYRYLVPPQPHVRSAARWLQSEAGAPTPARCLLAVQEARIALSRKPDDPDAYRMLAEAYRWLILNESAILAGQEPDPEVLDRTAPRPDLLRLRAAQQATALNYAIQTSPSPQGPQAREILVSLNIQLGQLYLALDDLDLARDRFQAALTMVDPGEVSEEFQLRIAEMDQRLADIDARLAEMPEASLADPLSRAQAALSLGAAGVAIDALFEAEQSGSRIAAIRPLLVDLLCLTGQPERAVDLLGSTEDPALSTGPGSSARRQGLVSFLIGNTEDAANLWEKRALAQLRSESVAQALRSGRQLLQGDAREATDGFLELPPRVGTDASWEADLGIALLEAGEPKRAGDRFTRSLELAPDQASRPIVAYYLQKLGRPLPADLDEEVQPPPPATPEPKPSANAEGRPADPEPKPAEDVKPTDPPGADEGQPKDEPS